MSRTAALTTLAGALLVGVAGCGSPTADDPALDNATKACEKARDMRDTVALGPVVAGDGASTLRDIAWYASLAYQANPRAYGAMQSALRTFTSAALSGGDVALAALDKADAACHSAGVL